jgi:hypothetical protein
MIITRRESFRARPMRLFNQLYDKILFYVMKKRIIENEFTQSTAH